MSKATVVMMLPYEWHREMSGHNPTYYTFPRAENNDFEVVVIGDTTSWTYIGEGKSLQRKHLAFDVAKELVDTYIEANLYISAEARPGVFYLEGDLTKDDVLDQFSEQLEEVRGKQNNWFVNLIAQADDAWQKHRLHREISTPQKLAAIALNQKREWLLDAIVDNTFQACKACGSTVKAGISICPICKVQLKENEFTFAGQ